MKREKQKTQQNYDAIADLYVSDFGTDTEHFEKFIPEENHHLRW